MKANLLDRIKGIKGNLVGVWLIYNPLTGERWKITSSSWRFACYTLNLDPDKMVVVHEGYGNYTPVILKYGPGEPLEDLGQPPAPEGGKEASNGGQS